MFDTLADTNAPARPALEADGEFLPDTFFVSPWKGTGVHCDAFGMVQGRYESHGKGRRDADGSLVLEQTLTFDSGAVVEFEWKIVSSARGKVKARDLRSGTDAIGETTRNGFLWRYKTRAGTPLGRRLCSVSILYVQTGPHQASNSSTINFMGVTVASATAHFHHVN